MQPSFFDTRPRFDGSDYQVVRDTHRLTAQLASIKALMLDGRWRSLREIEAATGAPQASISAQMRHLRKPRFGSYQVEKQYEGNGLYRYRVISK